jgi:membrane AbrB-like protein
MTGLVEGVPPHWLLDATLLVLGSAVGSRFSAIDRWVLVRLSGHAVIATALILSVTACAALATAWLLGLDVVTMLLAFAPGGVAEMSLIAVALNIDPGFVALHHLVRIFEILLLAPLVARLLIKPERA